ncbi:MAG TPA: hypothetical protein VGS27_31280 [Candidatus Sulfotelmatobacter sp.]|nr:hypothetical protein [Candidatus Sulfotelmatobacter sp.]HEV2470549.1 hypothetical protein [Candidatus Sulfotelmatobacter sp.]
MTEDAGGYDELAEVLTLEHYFPGLKGQTGYKRTSDATSEYNCLAWALGINWARYDPEPNCPGYYWFPNVERVWSLRAIRKIFEYHGYELCDSYELEHGYEKVVFYLDQSGEPQHFARQLADGKWTSKLGDFIDIEHDDLNSIVCTDYGKPGTVLRRRLRPNEL